MCSYFEKVDVELIVCCGLDALVLVRASAPGTRPTSRTPDKNPNIHERSATQIQTCIILLRILTVRTRYVTVLEILFYGGLDTPTSS